MDILEKIKKWVYTNPKKFYKYSMIVLFFLFIFNTISDLYTFKKEKKKVFLPQLYKQGDKIMKQYENKEKIIDEIVNELKELKVKREKGLLTANDSLRIEFLYNKYETLKDGKEKN